MSLAGQFAMTAARLLQYRAGTYASWALRLAQSGADQAADRVEAAAPRVATLTEAGLRLSEITYHCVDQLMRQGVESARGALADSTERLRMTARARSVFDLYAAQRAALPATRRRVVREVEATWSILRSASRDVFELARSTRSELQDGAVRETRGSPSRRATARHAANRKPRAQSEKPQRRKRKSRRRIGEQPGT